MNIFRKIFGKKEEKVIEKPKDSDDLREARKWLGILNNINNYDGTSKGQKVIR